MRSTGDKANKSSSRGDQRQGNGHFPNCSAVPGSRLLERAVTHILQILIKKGLYNVNCG